VAVTEGLVRVWFGVLGPVEVRSGSRRVRLRGPRQEKVVGTLLLEPGRTVPVGRLVESVWPSAPPATAARQIRNLTTALRRQLLFAGAPGRIIVADGPGFRLDLGGCRFDVAEFDSRVTWAEEAAAADRCGEAVTRLRAALDLWRGPAFAGLNSDVLQSVAARLEERRLATIDRCLSLELTVSSGHGLVGELTDLVACHPLNERFVAHLMLALYRADRQADALTAYLRLRATLRAELDTEPSTHLSQRYQQILRHDPSLATPPPGRSIALWFRPRQPLSRPAVLI
jgi:DNA-binding SARP family transcriptional activator